MSWTSSQSIPIDQSEVSDSAAQSLLLDTSFPGFQNYILWVSLLATRSSLYTASYLRLLCCFFFLSWPTTVGVLRDSVLSPCIAHSLPYTCFPELCFKPWSIFLKLPNVSRVQVSFLTSRLVISSLFSSSASTSNPSSVPVFPVSAANSLQLVTLAQDRVTPTAVKTCGIMTTIRMKKKPSLRRFLCYVQFST